MIQYHLRQYQTSSVNIPSSYCILFIAFYSFFAINPQCLLAQQPPPCSTDSIVLNTGYSPGTKAFLGNNALDSNWVLASAPTESTVPTPSASRVQMVTSSGNRFEGRIIQPQALTAATIPATAKPFIYQRLFCIPAAVDSIHLDIQLLSTVANSVFLDDTPITMTQRPLDAIGSFRIISTFEKTVPLTRNILNIHTLSIKLGAVNQSSQAAILLAGSITSTRPNAALRPFTSDTCCNTFSSIQGHLYNDKNCNGAIDSIERTLPVEGWAVRLLQNNTVVGTSVTDSTGLYHFPKVFPGSYSIMPGSSAEWNVTVPTGGKYNVVLSPNTFFDSTFGVCRQLCDSLTRGTLDSGCCLYHMQVVNVVGTPISKIRYSFGSASIKSLVTTPAFSSSVPTQVSLSSSGMLTFNPPVTGNILLTLQALPVVANSAVTPSLTIYHSSGDSCSLSASYTCDHSQQNDCDKLTATMYRQQNIDYNYIEFVITNKKLPASPICWVDILWSSPLPASYSGGSLQVIPNQRPLFTYPYTRIPIAPATSFNPGANSIRFNLGVNNTLGWGGTVSFVVHHCDGSTCTLNYGPCLWMPRP